MKVIRTEEDLIKLVANETSSVAMVTNLFIKGISLDSTLLVKGDIVFSDCVLESCVSSDPSYVQGFMPKGALYFSNCRLRNCTFERKARTNFESCHVGNCKLYNIALIQFEEKTIIQDSEIVNPVQMIELNAGSITKMLNLKIDAKKSIGFSAYGDWNLTSRNCEINSEKVIYGRNSTLRGTEYLNMILNLKGELFIYSGLILELIDFSKVDSNVKITGSNLTLRECDLSGVDMSFIDCDTVYAMDCKTTPETKFSDSYYLRNVGSIASGNFSMRKEGI